MRIRQSTAIASQTPTTPSPSGWIANQTRPMRSPHMPMMLTRRAKRTSPEARKIPPAITVKLKKISVVAATKRVRVPSATTSGSGLNRWMIGPENRATGTQARTMTIEPIQLIRTAKRSARSVRCAPSACPTSAVAV